MKNGDPSIVMKVTMKRLERRLDSLEALDLYALIQRDDGRPIYDPTNRESFLAQIDEGITQILKSESTMHGLRVQAMFEALVASFGKVLLLKVEDSGECWYRNGAVKVPDFRIAVDDDICILVETKNHFQKDDIGPFRMRRVDFDALQRYSDLSKTPWKLAIYWARWNLWTLIDPSIFRVTSDRAEVSFAEAMKANEMAIIGDMMVGTKAPLVLKLKADLNLPRSITDDGRCEFTIGAVEMSCAGVTINNEAEKRIAFYLMLFGKWEYGGGDLEMEEGLPIAVVHPFAPHPDQDMDAEQGFTIVGHLSSMFSASYNLHTLIEDGKVKKLRSEITPTSLEALIPEGYKGEALPLWIFVQKL